VRKSGAGAAGNQGFEGGLVGPQAAHLILEFGGQVALGETWAGKADGAAKGVRGGEDGAAYQGDLPRRFEQAEALDESKSGLERSAEAKVLVQVLMQLMRQAGAFEADRGGLEAGGEAEGGDHENAASDANRTGRFQRGLEAVAGVGEQDGAVWMEEQDGVGTGKAGEVADVGRVGDEQGVQAEGRELRQQKLAARDVLAGRNGRRHGIKRSLPAVRRAAKSR
jgi:hypothetical protein